MIRRASFSRCGKYRYRLQRQWNEGAGTCVFVGLNPSTADASKDDPTIRRCIGFALRWGFNRMIMVNLFAYRTPYPAKLRSVQDPVGPNNRRALRESFTQADRIVAAWGAHGWLHDQSTEIADRLAGLNVFCFGLTAQGEPLHPLYQRVNAPLIPWASACAA